MQQGSSERASPLTSSLAGTPLSPNKPTHQQPGSRQADRAEHPHPQPPTCSHMLKRARAHTHTHTHTRTRTYTHTHAHLHTQMHAPPARMPVHTLGLAGLPPACRAQPRWSLGPTPAAVAAAAAHSSAAHPHPHPHSSQCRTGPHLHACSTHSQARRVGGARLAVKKKKLTLLGHGWEDEPPKAQCALGLYHPVTMRRLAVKVDEAFCRRFRFRAGLLVALNILRAFALGWVLFYAVMGPGSLCGSLCRGLGCMLVFEVIIRQPFCMPKRICPC